MSLEKNKAIVRRWIEAFNKRNLAVLEELHAPDFVYHTRQQQGLESIKQSYTMFYKGFPDVHATIEDIIAEGNKAVIRFSTSGTHKGAYAGIPPTNKRIEITAINIFRLTDGKVAEQWVESNALGMLQQMGVVPPIK